MSHTVFCVLLNREAEALEQAPWPGELGEKILASVSKEGWQQWLRHQTMLINEKRLSPMKKEDRAYLAEQMEKYLFGGEFDQPEGYQPPE